ncbi:5'-nucleotidase domain-containing protein 1-like isoform X1 [Uloborus diversus]|uniref:5'-nucleotidase domain-containing protein 1-like isoform X1 n=1 Tax=Uloborus diversus TaxID=327109 RepID=UPI002409CC33|nr:5'-nucleotidase domain-containing protein 1-like isoform X1 [Uloborus diversus]
MALFKSFRLTVQLWTKVSQRSNSTKLTYAQRMCPQEFCLENYDCIGFDLDHTLCRYNLKPLINLIYETLSSYLVEKYEYPKSLAHATDKEMSFAQKGIILDKRKGNFLKLDNNYKIVKASHGTQMLSTEEICSIYGPKRIWEDSKGIPHRMVANTALDEPFYVFKDYFVTAGAIVCAKIVDILDEQHGKPLDEYSFWDHYLDGLFYMYERNNFKNNSGKFFPDLKHNPDRYLQHCSDDLKAWLKNVCKDKVSFLLTSSNYDSASFLAEYALGEDWKNYFDIIVTFARKPGFFWKDKPFCIIEENAEVSGIKPEDMKSHLIYSQGNWKDLQKACSLKSKSQNPKVLYFGDSLIEDVYAASEIAQCDTIAIVEEMLAEGMDSTPETHVESETLLSNCWGSFFGNGRHMGDSNQTFSLWAQMLSQHSKLTVPNLDCFMRLPLQEKIPCFGNESSTAGFFPGVPKVLASN